MPRLEENGYGVHVSDTTWFREMRAYMRQAFAPVHPALATMFWSNMHAKRAMCTHVMQDSGEGPVCVKCNHSP